MIIKNMVVKNKGFSLLEILIAMAIMAIMIAVAFPNLSKNSDQMAKKEALRLVAAIEFVRDQSIIMNQEYGLNIDEEGYQFLVLSEDDDNKPPTWQKIEGVPELELHEFPEELEVNLSIDGDNVFAVKEDDVEIFEEDIDIFEDEEESEKFEPPQIYFLSSGEQNQFSIGIAIDEKRFYRVRGFYSGDLKYEGPLVGDVHFDIDREFDEEL
jgi:general secretion pathway protein H